jgi:hypothetical protein
MTTMRYLLVFLLACGGSMATAVDGGIDGTASGKLTVANCPTSIAANVPAPYKSLFHCVTMAMSGTDLVITTTGLPPHDTYYYGSGSPNYVAWDSRGGAYHPNPNTLAATPTTLTIPLAPTSRNLTITSALVDGKAQTSIDEYHGGGVGIALDGVLMFDALAAPGDDIAVELYTFDTYNAHPAPGGAYHYHGDSPGPLAVAPAGVEAYGIMCDGTLVLGCTELDGSAPDQADLDAQNGHVHDVTDGAGATIRARYHVHVCPMWTAHPRPYTPEIQFYDRCTAS